MLRLKLRPAKMLPALFLSLAAAAGRAQTGAPPSDLNAPVTPYIEDQTMLVAHVDAAMIDTASMEKAAAGVIARLQAVPAGAMTKEEAAPLQQQLAAARLAADGFLARFKQAGGRHIYMLLDHQDIFPNFSGPALLFELEPVNGAPADAQRMTDLLKPLMPPDLVITPLKGNLVFAGAQGTLDRLKAVTPAARPNLRLTGGREGRGEGGDAGDMQGAAEVVFSATPDQRKAMVELMPTLPKELGSGPTEDLIEGVQNIRLMIAITPQLKAAMVITHTPEAGPKLADFFQKLRELVLSEMTTQMSGNQPEMRALLVDSKALVSSVLIPKSAGTTTTLSLDEAQVQSAAFLMRPSMHRAQQQAERVKSMNQVRQIVLSGYMYANDNHGIFPETLDLLVQQGSLKPEMLISPNNHKPFVYRRWVPEIAKYREGATTPVVWEQVDDPQEAVVVGFADGHCEVLPHRTDLDNLIAKAEEWAKGVQQNGTRGNLP